MTHPVDAMQDEAHAAIRAMIAAAREARRLHARAELMRHMRTTAAKMTDRPLEDAVRLVSGEWMQAWSLDAAAYPELAADIRRFTEAFCRDARDSDGSTQATMQDAIKALDAAFARIGTSIADQMAFRSECAHGWWELVVPTPVDLPGRAERPAVPRQAAGAPFWSAGAAPHCGARPIPQG